MRVVLPLILAVIAGGCSEPCREVNLAACDVKGPATAAPGAPIPLAISYERPGCVRVLATRHVLEGGRVTLHGDGEACICDTCGCGRGTLPATYELPGLPAGSYQIGVALRGGDELCAGGRTDLELVVK
jgi:hypothetical protein